MKSGNLNFLEPSGPLQACNMTALPLPLSFREVNELNVCFWNLCCKVCTRTRYLICIHLYLGITCNISFLNRYCTFCVYICYLLCVVNFKAYIITRIYPCSFLVMEYIMATLYIPAECDFSSQLKIFLPVSFIFLWSWTRCHISNA